MNLVIGVDAEAGGVDVLVDGKCVRHVEVDRDDIYPLASLRRPGERARARAPLPPGTEAYAFTFG